MTLKHKTFSAVRWTTASAVMRVLLQVTQIAVLARLLLPSDYGLMAIVAVALSFAGIFADFGLNSAYVHGRNVTPEQRSSLFWLNVAMSVGLFLLVIAVSPLIAQIFGDQRLILLLVLSASTLVIVAIGQQVKMTAEKSMDFRPVILIEFVSSLCGFVSSVIAAMSGWGVYALVLGSIVTTSADTLFVWIYVAKGWRPYWRFSINEVKPYLGFGGAMVGNSIVSQINLSIDVLLGARMLGVAQLGLFSIPRNLMLQLQFTVNGIITRVGFPLIAQVQNDIPQVRSIYLKTLNMTASTNALFFVGVAYFAPDIVQLLLGHQWNDSAPILRILALWAALRSTGNPSGILLFGMGRADLALKWNMALLFIVPPVLWMGSKYGAEGVSWALLLLQVVLFIPAWYVLIRPLCHAGLYEYSISALRPLLLASISLVPCIMFGILIKIPLLSLIFSAGIYGCSYLLLSYFFNKQWIEAMNSLLRGSRS